MPVDDYPTLPDMPSATGTVSSADFAHAVAQAVTAAGRDDMLPVLTGVRIEIDGSTMALLATDRFRLSHRELTWNPQSPDESVAALVPAKVLGDTAKSLTSGAEVTIALSSSGAGEGLIGFEGTGLGGVRRTTTRLLDGEFPKVRSLFPAEHLTVAKVNKAELIETVKRVALVAERNTAVQMKFGDTRSSSTPAPATRRWRPRRSTPTSPATTSPPASTRSSSSTASPPSTGSSSTSPSPRRPSRSSSPAPTPTTPDSFRYLLMPRRLLS